MFNPVVWWFRWVARRLADRGLIDEARGRRIADLAWPRFLTMLARFSLRLSDVSMVGLSVGSAAIVGMSFAVVYWQVAFAFAIGLAGGTIGLVAQRYGADRAGDGGTVLEQAAVLGLGLTLPFVLAYWVGAGELVRVFTGDPRTVGHGATYLRVSALALPLVTCNALASRALAGAGDTLIPMTVRTTGAVLNVGLNAVLIFGLGLGVLGAALASVLAEALVTVTFTWGFVRGELPAVGAVPIRLPADGSHVDPGTVRRLARTSAPLVAVWLGKVLVRFPLLALLATVGPTVVAAFEVARRVRNLLNAFGAGFSMSASSLVGQALGRADERAAVGVGRDAVAFSVVVYALAGTLVFALAPAVAGLFSTDPDTVARTTPFVRAASVSFVGLGIYRSFEGILKGAGDNRWSMYGRLFGLYALLLPLTYLGATTAWGRRAVFGALVAETWGAALVTAYRVRSEEWTLAGRSTRAPPGGD